MVSADRTSCTSPGLPTWAFVLIGCGALLLALALWRWFKARKTDKAEILLEVKEMVNEMHHMPEYQEPLLTTAPEPLRPVAVLDMRGLVSDLIMIGRGAFGAQRDLRVHVYVCSCVTARQRLYHDHRFFFICRDLLSNCILFRFNVSQCCPLFLLGFLQFSTCVLTLTRAI
jgi:hypothetical protein